MTKRRRPANSSEGDRPDLGVELTQSEAAQADLLPSIGASVSPVPSGVPDGLDKTAAVTMSVLIVACFVFIGFVVSIDVQPERLKLAVGAALAVVLGVSAVFLRHSVSRGVRGARQMTAGVMRAVADLVMPGKS